MSKTHWGGKISTKIVDLSVPLKAGGAVYPGYPTPIVHKWTTIEEDGYYSNLLQFAEHTATHVDSPSHFLEDGKTIDELPLEKFRGKGTVIDCTDLEPEAEINEEMIKERLKDGVKLDSDTILLFYTGYTEKAGTDEWLEHPGLNKSGATYLAEKEIKAVGLDTPGVDHDPFPGHNTLLPEEILIYENLANLDKLVDEKTFKFVGYPLLIQNGSASITRAFAELESV